jgi:hypothetical protein
MKIIAFKYFIINSTCTESSICLINERFFGVGSFKYLNCFINATLVVYMIYYSIKQINLEASWHLHEHEKPLGLIIKSTGIIPINLFLKTTMNVSEESSIAKISRMSAQNTALPI